MQLPAQTRTRQRRLRRVLRDTSVARATPLLWALMCTVAGCFSGHLAAQRPSAFAVAKFPRRSVAAVGAAISGLVGTGTAAIAEEVALAPSGTVKLRRVIAEGGLDDWTATDYQAMVDDEPRTKGYENAIKKRLAGMEGAATVVDIGTGSFAILATMAAKAGARKVYAIEKNAAAAKMARETVAKAGLQDKIEIIEGDSMQVELPEKVDLIVSELIGSIATQEGVEPIIKDAAKRFLKEGLKGGACPQMIPARVQTRIVPVKYTEHRIMRFAEKRGVLSRGKPEAGTVRPLRLRGKTNDLVFLSEPQTLEDFDFCAPEARGSQVDTKLKFDIMKDKVADAKDFSGFAMWTRLVIDDDNVVEVKGQKVTSHWAYVVALMADLPVAATNTIELTASVDYSASPVRYTLETELPV